MMRFRTVGGPAMLLSFRRLKGTTKDVLADALMAELEIEKSEVLKLTPRDTGALRESIRIVGPEFKGNTVSAYIVAGDESVDYALYVHEDPDAYHPVGQWKYIEEPLMQSGPHLMARVARRIQAEGGLV
jgi:hypothetical protein